MALFLTRTNSLSLVTCFVDIRNCVGSRHLVLIVDISELLVQTTVLEQTALRLPDLFCQLKHWVDETRGMYKLPMRTYIVAPKLCH